MEHLSRKTKKRKVVGHQLAINKYDLCGDIHFRSCKSSRDYSWIWDLKPRILRRNGSLAGAAESCKKGTLKVDLQALTVGVAVLSMASWLSNARQNLMQDQAGSLDSSRKLAVVNGLGEHSRAQVKAFWLSVISTASEWQVSGA